MDEKEPAGIFITRDGRRVSSYKEWMAASFPGYEFIQEEEPVTGDTHEGQSSEENPQTNLHGTEPENPKAIPETLQRQHHKRWAETSLPTCKEGVQAGKAGLRMIKAWQAAKRKVNRWLLQILGARNKLGVQCQEKGEAVYWYNREVQPNSIKAINIVDKDFWQRIWDENPRLQYAIYRECGNGPDPFDDPEGKAMAWVNYLKSKIGHLVEAGLVNVIEGYNEWIHSFQEAQFPAADRFMATLISETHRQFGGKVHIIVLNASCGHFSHDIVKFPKTLAALNQCPKCMLGLHEYDRDNMDRTAPFRCGKFQLVEQALDAAGCHNVSIALTEVGLDDCVDRPVGSPHRGWRHYGATIEEAVAHFLNNHNLAWYYPLLMASDRVKLASIFGCSMYWDGDNWGDMGFDLANRDGSFPAGLLDGIKNLEGSQPEPPPEPNGGNEMDIRVVDLEYKERDIEWAKAKYGVAFRRAEVEPGQKVYRLVELWEKTGTTACISQVLDENRQPMANVDVAFYWEDAPDQTPILTAHDWDRHFVHGPTNINGDVGPGFGPGAYHGEGEGGPHATWVRDPNIPADICEKLGMLAGTNHDHLDQKFQLMVEGGQPPPPPPPPSGELVRVGEYRATNVESSMFGIAYPADENAIDTRGSGTEPVGKIDDTLQPNPWTHPGTGKEYALVAMCVDFDDSNPNAGRTFTVEMYRMSDNKVLAGPAHLMVLPKPSLREHVFVIYDYGEPPPQPSPDGTPEELRQMAADLRQKATRLDALADDYDGTDILTVNLNGKEVGKGKQLTVSVD